MKAAVVAAALVCLFACVPSLPSGRFPGAQAAPVQGPSRAALLSAGLAADDARALALASADPAVLAGVFTGAALMDLEAAVAHLRRLGVRVERRVDSRRLVHWSSPSESALGVLEVSGSTRVVEAGGSAAWADYLEQWEFTLGWSGRWRVTQAADLAPGEWWT